MKKVRFTETQIISILKRKEAGISVKDLAREHLQRKKVKLSEGNFKREKIHVEDVDILCLLSLYKKNVKDKNKSVSEADRQQFKCLHYHYQPVTVN